tara:strand:+ start:8828 stop:9262 length:435 start_codon:yes stop_codon:yes gene_type:complete
MRQKPYWKIFLQRLLFSIVLVFATYNTFGFSYYHWALQTPFEGFAEAMGALKIVAGILLCICYMMLMWATYRAKGPVGILITVIVFGAVVYLLWAAEIIDFHNATSTTYLGEIIIALMLTLGSTWSIIWRRLTGQVAVEDPDTD